MMRYLPIILLMLVPVRLFAQERDSAYDGLDKFAEVLYLLEKNHVENVNRQKVTVQAAKALLRSVDPHSSYYTPEEYTLFRDGTQGDLVGIGVEVALKNGELIVLSVVFGGPAAKAGIEAGDSIIAVDEKTIAKLSFDEIIALLRGAENSSLKVTVKKFASLQIESYDIKRERLHIPQLQYRFPIRDYALIRLKSFTMSSASEFLNVLDTATKSNGGNLKGIIVDLRNNPGGFLKQALDLLSVFLDTGKELLTTRGRDGRIIATYSASAFGRKMTEIPVAVLINGNTASAAEIMAAALKDHKRAIIIGECSFGKGTVQNIFELDDGSAVKLTVAQYYSPQGKIIQGKGVCPDISTQGLRLRSEKSNRQVREKDLENAIVAESSATDDREEDINRMIAETEDITVWQALNYLKSKNNETDGSE